MSEEITLLERDLNIGLYHPEPPSNWVNTKPHGVMLLHKPTGLVVRCHEHPSAFANRSKAVKELDRLVKAYNKGGAELARLVKPIKKEGDEMEAKEAPNKFWLVWREGGQAPRVKHNTEEEALQEAVRLTNSAVGCNFYVLEAKSMHVAVSTTVSRALEDNQSV